MSARRARLAAFPASPIWQSRGSDGGVGGWVQTFSVNSNTQLAPPEPSGCPWMGRRSLVLPVGMELRVDVARPGSAMGAPQATGPADGQPAVSSTGTCVRAVLPPLPEGSACFPQKGSWEHSLVCPAGATLVNCTGMCVPRKPVHQTATVNHGSSSPKAEVQAAGGLKGAPHTDPGQAFLSLEDICSVWK